MRPFPRVKRGKSQGRPANVNAATGPKGSLLHVTDEVEGHKWLVDGGALVSIVPPTLAQRTAGPKSPSLSAANGSSIACYGTLEETVIFEGIAYTFEFVVADVEQRILGADFLASYSLAPNHRDGNILSLDTLQIVIPSPLTSNVSSVNAAASSSRFDDLLKSYPEITTPSFTLKEVSHGVEHHIPTEGQRPVQARARRLCPEKLAVAKAEIEKLCELGVCKRGKSEWSSPLLVTTKPDGG